MAQYSGKCVLCEKNSTDHKHIPCIIQHVKGGMAQDMSVRAPTVAGTNHSQQQTRDKI